MLLPCRSYPTLKHHRDVAWLKIDGTVSRDLEKKHLGHLRGVEQHRNHPDNSVQEDRSKPQTPNLGNMAGD